jgi:FMN phosphatase YigB (HAD superfamily)
MFVGDDPDADILGAAVLGMRTAWVHRGRDWPYDVRHPDYVISRVSEVRGLVLG